MRALVPFIAGLTAQVQQGPLARRITLKAATQCLRASAPSVTSRTTGTLLVAVFLVGVLRGGTEGQDPLGDLVILSWRSV